MTTEENKRMLALSCIVADLKTGNIELVERVHQLEDDYNNVVRQLEDNEKRKNEDLSSCGRRKSNATNWKERIRT